MAEFTIRIPDDLRERIKAAASADRRSMNGEIEWLLLVALGSRDAIDGPAPAVHDGDTHA